jgi:hypothetical protein
MDQRADGGATRRGDGGVRIGKSLNLSPRQLPGEGIISTEKLCINDSDKEFPRKDDPTQRSLCYRGFPTDLPTVNLAID